MESLASDLCQQFAHPTSVLCRVNRFSSVPTRIVHGSARVYRSNSGLFYPSADPSRAFHFRLDHPTPCVEDWPCASFFLLGLALMWVRSPYYQGDPQPYDLFYCYFSLCEKRYSSLGREFSEYQLLDAVAMKILLCYSSRAWLLFVSLQ